jgi:hypothetical protein
VHLGHYLLAVDQFLDLGFDVREELRGFLRREKMRIAAFGYRL